MPEYMIELRRSQHQTVSIEADNLQEAITRLDRADYAVDETNWSILGWEYLAPIDEDGEYDLAACWWEEVYPS